MPRTQDKYSENTLDFPCIMLYYPIMDTKTKLQKILDRTEAELQDLISSAAHEKDYDLAGDIAAIAKSLRSYQPTTINASASSENLRAEPKAKLLTTENRKSSRSAIQEDSYPKFSVHGQDLIKTGWSKKAKKEYIQKAPRGVLSALVESLCRRKEDEIFTIEAILPEITDANSDTFPSYQVYLAVGFLRANALVLQHGRQGYSLADARTLSRQVDSCWNSLKTKQH